MPIIVPEPAKSVIRVGPKVRTWEQGKILAFNDAYDHQVRRPRQPQQNLESPCVYVCVCVTQV